MNCMLQAFFRQTIAAPLFCILLCGPGRASASAPATSPAALSVPASSVDSSVSPMASPLGSQENARRLTFACELLLAGLGLELVASMGSVGLGLGAGVLASTPDDDGDAVLLDARGGRTFMAVSFV